MVARMLVSAEARAIGPRATKMPKGSTEFFTTSKAFTTTTIFHHQQGFSGQGGTKLGGGKKGSGMMETGTMAEAAAEPTSTAEKPDMCLFGPVPAP